MYPQNTKNSPSIADLKADWDERIDILCRQIDFFESLMDRCDKGRHFTEFQINAIDHAHTLFYAERRAMYVAANTLKNAPQDAKSDDVPAWLPDYAAARRWIDRNVCDADNSRDIQRAESGYPD